MVTEQITAQLTAVLLIGMFMGLILGIFGTIVIMKLFGMLKDLALGIKQLANQKSSASDKVRKIIW
jgi:hypothetical protein